VDAFVITVVFGALVATFISVMRTVNVGKVRTVASALATERVEELRNLPYDNLSTDNGSILPKGTIKGNETISRSGVSYNVVTTIIFVDSPSDGCAIPESGHYKCSPDNETSTSQDLAPYDFKRASVEVFQTGATLSLAKLVTDISAKASETPSSTGMLLVTILDANGNPVVGATITVTHTNPDIIVQGITNAQGYFFFTNLPPDTHNGYHIVVTKNGYSTDYTTDRTDQNKHQINPDVDINAQQVTSQTLKIDLVSTMNVQLINESSAPLGNLVVTATGGKEQYFNPSTPKNTYTVTADANGLATFSNIEWDSYTLTLPSGWNILTTSPYQSVSLNPNTTLAVTIMAAQESSWPAITKVTPISSNPDGSIELVIDGRNLGNTAAVVLKKLGMPDITGVVASGNSTEIKVNFNLTGAPTGYRDIMLTINTKTILQINGFNISP